MLISVLFLSLSVWAGEPAPAPDPVTSRSSLPPRPDPTAQQGTVVVDARLAAEISDGGQKLAQLYVPGIYTVTLPAGHRSLYVWIGGVPTEVPVDVPVGGTVRVVVGRNGTTTSMEAPREAIAGMVHLELHAVDAPIQVRLGNQREVIRAGEQVALDLPSGSLPFTVRSPDGTAIWANGTLDLRVGEPVIVVMSEGRLPEVSGDGAFLANGG